MKKFSLQTVLGVFVMALVTVLPLETSADVCFFAGGTTVDLDIAASNEQFHSLVGEVFFPNGQRAPIVGTARIRSDGVAEIGGLVPANPGTNNSFSFLGTLNPPGFNTGSAVFVDLSGQTGTSQLFFSPAPCPPQ
jgi:hypothetical protein